jgi:hypothetical protein
MKLGCFGCLGLIILILVVVVAGAVFVFMSANVFDIPDVKAPPVSRSEGHAAQQKFLEIASRQAGHSSRRDPVVLTERELNSFLARHLVESARIPLDPVFTRLTRGYFEIQGQTPFRNLLQGPPFAQILPYVPAGRLDAPVWVTLRGTVVVEPTGPGSQRMVARLRLTDLRLGKQPLAPSLLMLLLGPTGRRLTGFPVPSVIDSVQIEDGRLVIRTR